MARSNRPQVAAKTYYRPIEAAIRWCDLLRFEERILSKLDGRALPDPGEFHRWPMLRLNTERILDALSHRELTGYRPGAPHTEERLAPDDPSTVVRHVELRAWMTHHYPGERPAFLFGESECLQPPALSVDSLAFLLAEREAARGRLTELQQTHTALMAEHTALLEARQREPEKQAREPGPRAESTYLNIIGALLSLLLGKSPGGAPYSSFRNMDSVISALLAHHEHLPGISERTLWSKLAQARRHLQGMG